MSIISLTLIDIKFDAAGGPEIFRTKMICKLELCRNPNGPLSMTNAEEVAHEHARSSKFKRKVRSFADDDQERSGSRRDRLDEVPSIEAPFWDTYDAINQLYLELGKFYK